MHKKQPEKPVKTKRTKEINYFANLFCLVTQKSERPMARPTNFHSLPFNSTMHVQSPWKVHSDKRTEGRQISVFNIIDY